LKCAHLKPSQLGAIVATTGTHDTVFPGPAAAIAHKLGADKGPAFDLPMASAGGVFAIGLADTLACRYGNVLVVATEKMSPVSLRKPYERGVAGLFGDGAGACIITPSASGISARILNTTLRSDGSHAHQLTLSLEGRLKMNGRSVIANATQRISEAVRQVLVESETNSEDVKAFIMHQANLHVLHRVARALHIEEDRFFCNIDKYGNTSSASVLIALHEWLALAPPMRGDKFVIAGFGAGYHWGAALLEVE
ncbi:MAG TPA: 3-oxoacyl-[acyl-carrier-protein] synthase III C-terminal domain-containing protein, partial [Terriglobales bacterium]